MTGISGNPSFSFVGTTGGVNHKKPVGSAGGDENPTSLGNTNNPGGSTDQPPNIYGGLSTSA